MAGSRSLGGCKWPRIAVHDDGSPAHPRVTGDPLCEDGRGLLMVSALSARMGVGGNEKGRVAWADIPWTGQTMSSQLELPEGLRPQSAMSGQPAERDVHQAASR